MVKKEKPHEQYRRYICRTDPITGVFECYYGAAGGSIMLNKEGKLPPPRPIPPNPHPNPRPHPHPPPEPPLPPNPRPKHGHNSDWIIPLAIAGGAGAGYGMYKAWKKWSDAQDTESGEGGWRRGRYNEDTGEYNWDDETTPNAQGFDDTPDNIADGGGIEMRGEEGRITRPGESVEEGRGRYERVSQQDDDDGDDDDEDDGTFDNPNDEGNFVGEDQPLINNEQTWDAGEYGGEGDIGEGKVGDAPSNLAGEGADAGEAGETAEAFGGAAEASSEAATAAAQAGAGAGGAADAAAGAGEAAEGGWAEAADVAEAIGEGCAFM